MQISTVISKNNERHIKITSHNWMFSGNFLTFAQKEQLGCKSNLANLWSVLRTEIQQIFANLTNMFENELDRRV